MINICIRARARDRRTAAERQTATPTPRSTPTPSIESDAARDMITVQDFMTPARHCVTACTTDTIESAVHALAYDGVGCVVVLDVGKPVGMFTKRDALEAWLEAVPLDALCGSVANKTVITASPSMTRDEAAAIMMRHHVHHVCVTDGEGAFIGVCSSYDIARECGREACLPFWNEFVERVNVRARPSAPA